MNTQDFPYCRIRRDAVGRVLREYSVEMQLLATFERRLNFTGSLVDGNQSWGMIVNGKWQGTIGHVFDGVRTI